MARSEASKHGSGAPGLQGAERLRSTETGKPSTGEPSSFHAYTCSPAEATISGSRSPSMSPIAGIRSDSRGGPPARSRSGA